MDENNLKQLWLNSVNDQRIEINTEKLIESLNQKLLHMEKQIKRRDRREIFIGILTMPIFGWWLLTAPQVLAKIGAAIILVNWVLVIFKLSHARKVAVKVEAASEIKYQLEVSLQRIRQQIKLSDTVLWWYVLPFFIGVICFFYAYPLTIISKAAYTIIVAVLYGYIWHLNKKVVGKKLKPMENNIIKALNELSASE